MSEDDNFLQSLVQLDKYRNPTFGPEEVEALVKLVEKYKTIILNKSTVSAVNHGKEAAWIKIAEEFNKQGFRHTRDSENLKTKWENLKRHAKKVSNNLMDSKYNEFNDLSNPVVALLCEAEMSSRVTEVPEDIKEELKKTMDEQKVDSVNKISDNYNHQESDDSDGDTDFRKMRSLNFSPQESSLLLKCVKDEQKYVFTKENTKKAIQLKRKAWSRITNAFNERSPQKRSTITLQTKFCNMKRNVKDRYFKKTFSNKKRKRLVEEEIKAEPKTESKMPFAKHEDHNGDESDDILNGLPDSGTKHLTDIAPDPIDDAFDNECGADGDCERRNRSLNFSPYEVSILLKCVRDEQKYILAKDNTARTINQKNKAWTRITEAFNKETQQLRSTKVLKTKFANLKKNVRFSRSFYRSCLKSKRPDRLVEENSMEVKAEPSFGYRSESDNDIGLADEDCNNDNDGLGDSASIPSPEPDPDPLPDPLATVFSSDSGLGSTSFIGAYNFGNNEVTKLKIELLKYQLENTKLERQRIQEAMREEAAARESLAIERSLRLRAARLEAVAAELKLPPAHPALMYTREETPAQHYVDQYPQ